VRSVRSIRRATRPPGRGTGGRSSTSSRGRPRTTDRSILGRPSPVAEAGGARMRSRRPLNFVEIRGRAGPPVAYFLPPRPRRGGARGASRERVEHAPGSDAGRVPAGDLGHRVGAREPRRVRGEAALDRGDRRAPCRRAPGLDVRRPEAVPDTKEVSGMAKATILVVDDDPDAVEIAESDLSAQGYEVHTAYGGQEALAKLEEVQPDAVLLDVMMPEMDGWEVSRAIKNHPRFRDVRVIMFTARGDFTDKQEGLRSGADDYIVKPVRLDDLGQTVERNLEVRRRSA